MRLIDEIEADAVLYSDACDLMQSDYWPRIKAALEAGEEMAVQAENMKRELGMIPPAIESWLARFRAATEGTK